MADGNLYIPQWHDDLTSAYCHRYTFLQSDTVTQGVRVQFYKRGNVWVLTDMQAGIMRPAFFPAWDDWVLTGTGSDIGNNAKYAPFNRADPDEKMEWTVPAAAAGMDKLIVVYYGVVGSGEVEVLRDGNSCGHVETNHGSSVTELEATITLDQALAENDVVKIRWKTGETDPARIHGVIAYESTGTCGTGDGRYLIGATTDLFATGTCMETAFSFRLAGTGAYKWCGGYHNAGTGNDAQQVSIDESFTVDGGAWDLANGFKIATAGFTWARTSTVQYDDTPTNVASMAETYTLAGGTLGYAWSWTNTASLDFNARYAAMLPMNEAITPKQLIADNGNWYDVSALGADLDLDTGVETIRIFGGMANACKQIKLDSSSVGPASVMFLQATLKVYFNQLAKDTSDLATADDAVYTGGWTYTARTGLALGGGSYIITGDLTFGASDLVDLGSAYIENPGSFDGENGSFFADEDNLVHIVCTGTGEITNFDPNQMVHCHGDASVDGGGNGANLTFNTHAPPGSLALMGVGVA